MPAPLSTDDRVTPDPKRLLPVLAIRQGGSARLSLRPAISFPVFLGAVLVAAGMASTCWVFGVPGASLLSTGDTWWHLAVGDNILAQRTWPAHDSYSYTAAGQPWIANEWLGEVLMAAAFRLGAFRGLVWLLALLVATFEVLLYYSAWLRSKNSKASALACLLLLPLAAATFTLRPQLLGYIFLVAVLICLEHFRQGRSRALWILPAIFLFWVNTHGSFAFGLLAIGAYWAAGLLNFRWKGLAANSWTPPQRRRLAVVSLLCVLALLVTPYGSQLAADPIRLALFHHVTETDIREWQPLTFNLLFVGLLSLFLLAQIFAASLPWHLEDLALLLFSVYAACEHRRFLIVFVVFFAPLAARLLARWVPPYEPRIDKYWLNAILILLILLGLIKLLPSNQRFERMIAQCYPSGAVGYLRQHPAVGARLLNEVDWGGYLIWSLGPGHKVFIDGRADMYEPGGILSDYEQTIQFGPGTPFFLRKYEIQACLILKSAALGTYLAVSPDWVRVYEDRISTIFVRKRGGG